MLWIENLGSGREEGTYWREIADKFIITLSIMTNVTEYILQNLRFFYLVEPIGIEPTTSWMPFKRSPIWATAPLSYWT